ncbi:MAG: hypothetical protein Kow0090_15320 [Myxococcota bacterium]
MADLAQRTERLISALEEITEAMGTSYNIDDLFMIVVEAVTAVMEAERSTLYLVDSRRGEIWSKIAQGSEVSEIRLPIGVGVAGWCAEKGQPALIHDAYQDARFDPEVDRRSGFQTKSMLVQPMMDKDGRVVGVIQALNKRSGSFDAEDQRLLAIIAQQTATGLTLSNLYSEILERYKELQKTKSELEVKVDEQNVLYQVEKSISNATDLESLIENILLQTTRVMKAKAGSVLMRDGNKSELYFLSAVGEKKEVVKRMRLRLGQGIIGLVAKEGEAVISNSPETDARHDVEIAQKLQFPAESIICVPLKSNGEIIGALEILNKEEAFDEDDLKLLTLIAGQVSRAISLFMDRSRKEQERRFSTIGQMLSSVLHDIKTPLTIISGYVQLMAMEDSSDKRNSYVEEVLKQFDLLNRMTKDLLAFVKGKRTIIPVKVNLNDFIEEITSDLTREFTNTGVLLRIDAAFKGVARFDPDKMKRVIYNIARNAREAMSDGGEFKWSIFQEGGNLVFVFSDNGKGMEADIVKKLFQPFASFGKSDGTGLGLVIAKSIIEEHQGEISLESTPNVGTTITLKIPSADVQ